MEDPRKQSFVNHILWSDPEVGIKGWQVGTRGPSSKAFGKDVLEEKLKEMNLELVIRAHQCCEEGYRFFGNRKLVTIFSAPSYTERDCRDKQGAVVKVDSSLVCSFTFFCPRKRFTRIKARREEGRDSMGGINPALLRRAESVQRTKSSSSQQSNSVSSENPSTPRKKKTNM